MKKHFVGNKLISVVGYLARCKDTSQLKHTYHSNGNGQPLISNNVEYLENLSDTLRPNLNCLNYWTYTTCMRN